jgi:hypothetical protein
MSPAFEAYLARIYTDETERALFLADASFRARLAGLREEEVKALEGIDRDGLALAAASFSRKRAQAGGRGLRSRTRRTILPSVSGLNGFWMNSLRGSRTPRSSK